ncbi:uncharacterized protein KY384_007273 [Bacidia gigantensis]|uniref:uncharacterized protein n=1 Tax=Bacidia gigantensis TaxID=2732470 RepID=UPI001D0537B5|nr:uncharacterized protein KY384_007273 [Bacidia gigantensis]KAG8528355.1 hypothetical protein KY384_007273 [Bacidia gigantensis]
MNITRNVVVSGVFFSVAVILLLSTFYTQHKPHKGRFIFVDLGANRADSLETFLKHKGAKFDFDFPRPSWATHDQAEIYLFEANPVFNPALVEAKQKYDELGINVNIYPSTVVDVKDGTRTFYLDNVNTEHDYWGSSTHATHPDAVKSHSNGTEIVAIGISRWLLMNTLPRDFVVVKMDIEGSEFEVIPKMVEMSIWTVLDYLFVEWHGGFIQNDEGFPQTEARVKKAQEVLISKGVQMPSYDSGA